MQRFSGRVAYVTGGGHGIGRAVAMRLALEGASVAVSDIDREAAGSVAVEIVSLGGIAIAENADITDMQSVERSIEETVAKLGNLDILVNTAGGDWIEPGPG